MFCFVLSYRIAMVSPLFLVFDLAPIGSALPFNSPSRGKSGATTMSSGGMHGLENAIIGR